MFTRVFIVQHKDTGKFMTRNMNYTYNLRKAGYFFDRDSALDTAILSLDSDFEIYDFYKPTSELEHL